MSWTHVSRATPLSRWSIPESANEDNKVALLRPAQVNETLNPTLMPIDFVPRPDTRKMSLDAWVAHEMRTCSRSRAPEAARRIRTVQRSQGELLNLVHLHLHSVPPLVGCEQVKFYWLTANYLMQIPNNLGDLPHLQSLAIESNGLREIPLFSQYKNLKMVGVGGNPLTRIPSGLKSRPVAVITTDTLVKKWQRRQYRAGQRRRRLRDFIIRVLPWFPQRCLPPIDKDIPTFTGGNLCDRGVRPFPFPTRCDSLKFVDSVLPS